VKILIFIFVLISLYQCEIIGVKAQDFDPVYDVADVMADLLKSAPNRPLYKSLEKRKAFAIDIVDYANCNMVPELLLTVKIYNESSFRTDAVSPDGTTTGLGQMHGAATRNCDTKTRKGQIGCMAHWMRKCYEKCQKNNRDGEWFEALSCYGTSGHCNYRKAKYPKKYKHAINRQIKMWLKYEQQREMIRAEIVDDLEHYASEKE